MNDCTHAALAKLALDWVPADSTDDGMLQASLLSFGMVVEGRDRVVVVPDRVSGTALEPLLGFRERADVRQLGVSSTWDRSILFLGTS